jgi:hypothetical protein
VETIFTKIPNCCHYPPPYCTPQDRTRAVRREGGRGWRDKFGKVLLKTLHLNYDIFGTGKKKESHLLIGKHEIKVKGNKGDQGAQSRGKRYGISGWEDMRERRGRSLKDA